MIFMKKPLIKKREKQISEKYKIAYDFSGKVYKQFNQIIKSIILFGSTAKDTAKERSDIDLIIIIDDATIKWDDELIAWYREELAKLVAASKYKDKLHINTVTLTTFWNEVLVGEPIVINVIRYGVALIDFGGFFEPLKILLARGRIRPSSEAIYNALQRAPMHLGRAKYAVLTSVDASYWAMVDSAHAALMAAGKTPPSPEYIPDMLNETFVKKGKLNSKFVEWFKEIYALAHYISHGEISELSGKEIEVYRERADSFVGEMASLVTKSS